MAVPLKEEFWENALESVGLPSRKRYNTMVANAANELKMGGDTAKAGAWATLALAEATLLSEED
jgi:hypothetical protein